MFGSNPFGQSSTSFGSQSVFGQTASANSNPFAPKPFGSTTPFGSQSSSIFGGTPAGVFGSAQSSPLGSTTPFGSSSSPAFGSSVSAFGTSSTPAFGSSSPAFGGSSAFGQKPTFGGFGSTTQTSPFGSTFQQSQPAFGGGLFGSTSPFGASSQPTFGSTSTPAFGSSSTPSFGISTTPAFGAPNTTPFGSTSTPAFGATSTPAFGNTTAGFGVSSSPVFGTGGAFGASNSPAFGSSTTPTFGSSAPLFGAPNTSVFGAPNTPSFASSTASTFGTSSNPSFSFGNTAFGQSAPTFGTSPFGSSPFGASSSPFGSQATTPTFGTSTGFGQATFGQQGGTRVSAYLPTTEADSGSSTQSAGKLESISAMPVYKDKSHEELRWEDYQMGYKGGPSSATQPTGINFGVSNTQSSPFGSLSSFTPASSNPFSASAPSNPFAAKPAFSSSAFGTSVFSSPITTSSFGSTPSATTSIFGVQSSSPFAPSSQSLFGSSTMPSFGSSPSIFGSASTSAMAPSTGSAFSFGNTQSSPLFQPAAPLFSQSGPAFGQTTANPFGQGSVPSFNQPGIFSTPTTGFSNFFSSTPSLLPSSSPAFGQTMASLSTPFNPVQTPQTSNAFGFGNFGAMQPFGSSGFGNTPSIYGQSGFGQTSVVPNSAIIQQPSAVSNPFGTLPAVPQMSIGRAGATPSIQYGISSLPVGDKPTPLRLSSLLTTRNLSQRRFRLPARKYDAKSDDTMVPLFSVDEELPTTPKADALFIPRENPRDLIIRPIEQWAVRPTFEETTLKVQESMKIHENGISFEEKGPITTTSNGPSAVDKGKGIAENGHAGGKKEGRKQEGTVVRKLRNTEYYTEPSVSEMEEKERVEPGFCSRVNEFVVGRREYGSIKFSGETDVRGIDVEEVVQFNNREVIVYMDESKKPGVGQGLNKAAVVTLLNIKCFDKKSGKQYTQGVKIERYKEMLAKKAEDQGAQFVSYDPLTGEWKFRVTHFSFYKFDEYYEHCEDCEDDEDEL